LHIYITWICTVIVFSIQIRFSMLILVWIFISAVIFNCCFGSEGKDASWCQMRVAISHILQLIIYNGPNAQDSGNAPPHQKSLKSMKLWLRSLRCGDLSISQNDGRRKFQQWNIASCNAPLLKLVIPNCGMHCKCSTALTCTILGRSVKALWIYVDFW